MVFDSLIHSRNFSKACSVEAPGLEGYLFPETYQLPFKMNEAEILRIMVKQFLEVIRNLDLSTSKLFNKYGMHGLITLASIVEAEAAVKSEQKLIAGVFYNRLEKNWPLGADPTIRFALKKLKGPLLASELRISSPYNTRKYVGLPLGPICSPGKYAILAAAFPQPTEYLYFVAKDDGSREHFFSRTSSQHRKFKRIRMKNQTIYKN